MKPRKLLRLGIVTALGVQIACHASFAKTFFPFLGRLAKSGGPDAVCKIIVKGQFACSGTLINSTQLITAAHCQLAIQKDTSIECGDQTSGTYEVHHVKSLQIDSQYLGEQRSAHDLALITLNEPSKIPPIRRATAEDLKPYADKEGDLYYVPPECRAAGFGFSRGPEEAPPEKGVETVRLIIFDGDDSEHHGVLHEVRFPKNKLKFYTDANGLMVAWDEIKQVEDKDREKILKTTYSQRFQPDVRGADNAGALHADRIKVFGSIMGKGDSGGPLFCRNTKTNEWFLLGVASHGGIGEGKDKKLQNSATWGFLDPKTKFTPAKLSTVKIKTDTSPFKSFIDQIKGMQGVKLLGDDEANDAR